jgi:hypothetical protein
MQRYGNTHKGFIGWPLCIIGSLTGDAQDLKWVCAIDLLMVTYHTKITSIEQALVEGRDWEWTTTVEACSAFMQS